MGLREADMDVMCTADLGGGSSGRNGGQEGIAEIAGDADNNSTGDGTSCRSDTASLIIKLIALNCHRQIDNGLTDAQWRRRFDNMKNSYEIRLQAEIRLREEERQRADYWRRLTRLYVLIRKQQYGQ